jgi:hypothetical protein
MWLWFDLWFLSIFSLIEGNKKKLDKILKMTPQSINKNAELREILTLAIKKKI